MCFLIEVQTKLTPYSCYSAQIATVFLVNNLCARSIMQNDRAGCGLKRECVSVCMYVSECVGVFIVVQIHPIYYSCFSAQITTVFKRERERGGESQAGNICGESHGTFHYAGHTLSQAI